MTTEDQIAVAREELRNARNNIVAALKTDRSRKRGPLVRQLHEIQQMLNPTNQYFSQAGQDTVVDRYFKEKRGGTFLDVGGYDGITGSNTWFFEKMRGWTGALVEPVASQRNLASVFRNCPCLGYAISDSDGTAEFMTITEGFTQMSGLLGSYESTMLDRVRADPRHAEIVLNVPTRTLSSVLIEVGIPNPDFVSLDIEGGELVALKGFPFEKHRVGAWSIENNTGSPAIGELLGEQGYKRIEFCGPDEIYILQIS